MPAAILSAQRVEVRLLVCLTKPVKLNVRCKMPLYHPSRYPTWSLICFQITSDGSSEESARNLLSINAELLRRHSAAEIDIMITNAELIEAIGQKYCPNIPCMDLGDLKMILEVGVEHNAVTQNQASQISEVLDRYPDDTEENHNILFQ